jgi:hypothetical protein
MSEHVAPSHSKCGTVSEWSFDGGPVVVTDIVRCVHCFYSWKWIPGSGKHRGFCTRCNGLTCGDPACEANGCVCQEAWLDNVEAGRPEDYKQIIVAVPGGVPCR